MSAQSPQKLAVARIMHYHFAVVAGDASRNELEAAILKELTPTAADPDPIPAAQSPWSVVMASTCSGAWPRIVEACMDPDTGALWEREVANLDTTHVETQAARESDELPGTFNTKPDRFELNTGADFDPAEVFAVASVLATAPALLSAAESLVEKLRGMAIHPSHYAELEAVITTANTPYIPTPNPSRD